MIPSNTWFPQSLAERAVWFTNFTNNFTILAAGLGFLPADVTAVTGDNAAFQYMAQTAITIDAFSKGMTAYRKEICEGTNGSPAATIPETPDLGTPKTALPGIFERLDDLVKRIRVAPSYSAEEGEQLGIVPTSGPSKSSLENESPNLKAKALPGNVVEVSFVRGVSNGIVVETKLDNDLDWHDGGKFVKSPAELNIPVLNGNLPRAVQIRGRFLDGNKPIGLYSNVVNIVTTP